jgi:hypothetical protein
LFVQLYKFSGCGHKQTIITTYYEDNVNNDSVCFQAIVAAFVYLTATCNGLTTGYSAILLPQLRANSSDFEVDEDVEPWIGKGRDLFYLHTQVNLPHSGARDLYFF